MFVAEVSQAWNNDDFSPSEEKTLLQAERGTANVGKIQTQLGCVLCVFSGQMKKCEKFDSLDLQSWNP